MVVIDFKKIYTKPRMVSAVYLGSWLLWQDQTWWTFSTIFMVGFYLCAGWANWITYDSVNGALKQEDGDE